MKHRKWICLVLLVLFPVLGVSAAHAHRAIKRNHDTGSPAVTGHNWALVIGINEYDDPNVPDLATAVNDARAVADLLERRLGFDRGRIIELYDGDATRPGIIDALSRLILETGENDRVLIYYAGHGELWHRGRSSFQIRDKKEIQEMKQYGMGFWIPASARLGVISGYLSNAELRTLLAQLDVDHLLLVSDSCYSGGLTERGFNPRYPEGPVGEAMQLRSRLLLSSGGLHPVPDSSRISRCAGHSTFACYFLKFLEEAQDGYLTTRKLYSSLYEPVTSNAEQEPHLDKFLNMGHEGGQFVFTIEEDDEDSLLSVNSNATGARVRLDGRELGETPLEKSPVAPGEYRLSVEKDGCETEQRTVRVSPGRHASLYVSLKCGGPEKSRLYVNTDPDGARVRILNIAPVFVQGMALAPGRYEVEVSADGCGTESRWITLTPGRDEYVDMNLKCGGEPGDRFTNSLGMEFVRIEPGSFMMGSPEDEPKRDDDEKQHRVTLTKGFYMGTMEVTVADWKAFVKATGYRTEAEKGDGAYVWTGGKWEKKADADWRNPYFSQTDRHPVTCISWNDAQAFIQWLNRKEGKTYRLPTEAEWEYAARAGADTPFAYGECLATDQANYNGNYPMEGCSKGEYRERTVPAGSLNAPNRWGLHDMHGNVWEWCADWYGEYPSGSVTDPTGPSSGKYRVLRGGGWYNSARNCRSAIRFGSTPGNRNHNNGFRLVLPAGR